MKTLLILLCLSYSSIGFSQELTDDKTKIQSIFANKNSTTWVFTGNSITQGAKHTHGMRSYPEIFEERIRWEMGRFADVVINTAISGNTTKNILDGFKQRVIRFQPDVVVLMIGTNDAAVRNNISIDQFEKNLTVLIGNIRETGAIPVLLTPTPIIIDKAPERKDLEKYVVKIREIALQNNVVLVDNWLIWNTDLQEKYSNSVNRKLLNDPLHPNGYGHQEIAIALFKKLSIFETNAPTCGGEYYEGEH